MKLILILIGACAAPAFAQTPADCGHYLETLVTTTFAVDQPTQRDLNVTELVTPVIAQHVATALGRARLKWLIENSNVRAEEVRHRQRAVRFYFDHPAERARAKELLAAVHGAAHGATLKDLAELAEHDTKYRMIMDHVRSFIAFGGVGAAGTGAAVGLFDFKAAFPLFMMLVVINQHNTKDEEYSRARMRPFSPMVNLIDAIVADLAAAEPSTLTDVRDGLVALIDAERPGNVAGLGKMLAGMRKRPRAEFGALLGMSNIFTARARRRVVRHQHALITLASLIGELDVIVALAEAATVNHHVFPEILDDAHPTTLSITNGHHPYVYDKKFEHSVPNSLELTADRASEAPKFLLLTGPNTGGKSTYLKMIASLTLLAQMGGAVPAEAMRLTPMALLTNMTAQDVLQDGHSFFYAQGARVKEILDRAEGQPHVLILMDEILNGTSPEEHTAIEQAIIKFLVKSETVSILATHDRKLQAMEQTLAGVINIHVDDKASETFRIKRGPSLHRNAIQVLREVGLPNEITEDAQAYLDEHLAQP